jgi:hypothetical protein
LSAALTACRCPGSAVFVLDLLDLALAEKHLPLVVAEPRDRGHFGANGVRRVVGIHAVAAIGLQEWEAGQMVSRLKPDDLTTGELAALVAVLHAAHARAITPPTGDRPFLRIVPKALGGLGTERPSRRLNK